MLHDIIINIQIFKNCFFELKKSSFNIWFVIDEPTSKSLNYIHILNCLLKFSIISHQKLDTWIHNYKAMFIWLPLSSKERMVEFNLAYNSLKSKILQPIHNPTTIYIKILYIKFKIGNTRHNNRYPNFKNLLFWT